MPRSRPKPSSFLYGTSNPAFASRAATTGYGKSSPISRRYDSIASGSTKSPGTIGSVVTPSKSGTSPTPSGGKPSTPPSAKSPTASKVAAATSPTAPKPKPRDTDKSIQDLRYPEKISPTQDVIKFEVVEYVPIGTSLTRSSARALGRPGATSGGKSLAKIYLPMPNDINVGNTVSWNEGDLNSFAALAYQASVGLMGVDNKAELNALGSELKAALESTGLMGKDGVDAAQKALAGAAAGALTGANIDMNTIFSRTSGQIINPNKELLFGGVNLREFSYSFVFSPRSPEEGQTVRKIIHTFKKYSAAKSGNKGGFFLSSPDVFRISYLHQNAKDHPFLNKMKVCALKSVQVNYTGSSVYSTYYDGTPTHIVMGLTFGEIEPIYYEDFENADASDAGTGY
jgi:hypothetical protein